MKIEVFKAGTHTDSSGVTRTWTDSQVDEIAAKYNDQSQHDAPVVIGHPKHNAPAWGWVQKLEAAGGMLYAHLKDLADDFVEAWKAGRYKKRSISLYPDGTLRHVGFLGAMPPAVKGLGDAQFHDDAEPLTYDFSDEESQSLRDDYERLLARIGALETLWKATPAPSPISETTMEVTSDENHATPEFAELSKTVTDQAKLLSEQAKLIEDLRRENLETSFSAFLGSKEMECRASTAPRRATALSMLRNAAKVEGEVEFAEGDATVKGSALDAVKAELRGWVALDLSEFATPDMAPALEDIDGIAERVKAATAAVNGHVNARA